MDKSLVGEGAVGKDVYEQYLETLGGLKLPYDEVFENLKHKISHINSCSTAASREFDFVDGGILIILCGLISVVTKSLILMPIMLMEKKE